MVKTYPLESISLEQAMEKQFRLVDTACRFFTGTEILDYQDETAYDFTRTDENLILYTCYPFDALGFTPNRFFVYAKYVSGPVLDANS